MAYQLPDQPRDELHRNNGLWYENGRCYGNYRRGQYLFPIDEQENDRLDIFHTFFKVARRDMLTKWMPELVSKNGQKPRILDLGTGTGIWAIEMAEQLKNQADVWGVDLNYSQPASIPPSVTFPHAFDIEETWRIPDEDFDLIHIRLLLGSIARWQDIYNKCFKHLKAGGKFEQVEMDFEPHDANGPIDQNSHLVRWYNMLMSAMDQVGRPMRIQLNTPDKLSAAGFVDVQQEVIRVPFAPWSRERHEQDIARWFNLVMMHGIEGLTLAPFTRVLHRPVEEVREFINNFKGEICGSDAPTYCKMYIWTASKPR